jgi:hypothetical protein
MYGYYGAGYDLGDYEGDDMGGVMDYLKQDVMGVPVWALGLGALAFAFYTAPGKRLLGGLGIGKKKNPRRRSRKLKMNRRRRNRRSRR